MTQKDIVDGSKIIANYLGWQYIPFDNLQGYSKAGWWQIPFLDEKGKLFDYVSTEVKNHRSKIGGRYYVCRNHGELRFWNSLDALAPVIQQIEKENMNIKFHLNNNGCEIKIDKSWAHNSFSLPNWSNNVFKVVVETVSSLTTK